MVDYTRMDLKGMIQTYAIFISCEVGCGRGEIHMAICERLKVDHDDFNPFGKEDITETPTQKEATRMIKEEISRLKRGE